MPVATAMKSRRLTGKGVNSINAPSEVYGSTVPKRTTNMVVNVSGKLGRLWKGFPVVRITKITKVWVGKDSTNQPL